LYEACIAFEIVLDAKDAAVRGLAHLTTGVYRIAGTWTGPDVAGGELDLLIRRPSPEHFEVFVETTDTWTPTRSREHLRRFIEFALALCDALGSRLMFLTGGEGEPLRSATRELLGQDVARASAYALGLMADHIYVVHDELYAASMFESLVNAGWSIAALESYRIVSALP
jgi:hypothetical protein